MIDNELNLILKILKQKYPFVLSVDLAPTPQEIYTKRTEYIDITISVPKLINYLNASYGDLTSRTRMNFQFDMNVLNLHLIFNVEDIKDEAKEIQSNIVFIMNRVHNMLPSYNRINAQKLEMGFIIITE